MANKNKKQLKEFGLGISQSIPTSKSILNYKDDEVVAAIKKEIDKEKDFTVLKITHQSNQYYNIVVSFIVPDEDWSFELDKYKYIQLLHQYRVDLFTELSKVIPVVNVNLAAFDFIKGGSEIKFALTVLLSDTNNKDWVTGRRKQTIDQRERLKLLQTESVKKTIKWYLNEDAFEPYTLKQREVEYPFEDYKIAVFDEVANQGEGISSQEIQELLNRYIGKVKQAWYEQESPESMAVHLLTANQPRHESEKVNLAENTYNYNQPDYTYYVCEIIQGNPLKLVINEGFDDKEDAQLRIKEQIDEGNTEGLTFRVLSGKFLKQKRFDPNDDANWGNPSYMAEPTEQEMLESFEDQKGTWINEDVGDPKEVISFIGNKDFATSVFHDLKKKNASPTIKKGKNKWRIDVLRTVLSKLGIPAKKLDTTFKTIPGYEGFSYFGGDPGGLYEDAYYEKNIEEDVELDYEFAPDNVPGTPTSDDDFLESDENMKSVPVKESELVEGKLYSLFQSNGLIIETVQYIKKYEGKHLFEKSASGRRLKLSEKDISLYLKKVMKKKPLNEGWKKREEFNSNDAFADIEKIRGLPGVIQTNAVTKNQLVVIYDSRKIDGETIKKKFIKSTVIPEDVSYVGSKKGKRDGNFVHM